MANVTAISVRIIIGLLILLNFGCRDSSSNEVTVSITPSVTAEKPIGIEITMKPRATRTIQLTRTTSRGEPTTTPSPTPFEYIIREGDTIYDIAQANNTTVDVLLELNPSLTPELLGVGQTLFLPFTSTPEAIAQEVAVAEQLDLEIRGISNYVTPHNGLWLLGEVRNVSSEIAGTVRIRASVQDFSGNELITQEIDVLPALILPGESRPFAYLFDQRPDTEFIVDATIVSFHGTADPNIRSQDLAVEISEDTIESTRVSLRGSIMNLASEPVGEITLIATFYDENRSVSGFQLQNLEGVIPPGETVEFNLDTVAVGPVKSALVTALGMSSGD